MMSKANIIAVVDDMVSDFLYYDRKEDEDLPRGAIEKSIKNGDITITEIVSRFEQQLRQGVKNYE